MKKLVSSNTSPVILEIFTDGTVSANVFTEFFNKK